MGRPPPTPQIHLVGVTVRLWMVLVGWGVLCSLASLTSLISLALPKEGGGTQASGCTPSPEHSSLLRCSIIFNNNKAQRPKKALDMEISAGQA